MCPIDLFTDDDDDDTVMCVRVLLVGFRRNFTAAADDVEGTWELVFSTQLKSGYMPVRELIQFYPSRQKILIDTKAGPLPLGG